MKAMNAMKKKAVSKIAKGRMAKVLVFRGSKEKTVGGMTASSLTKNKTGKIVSKKKSALGKKNTWMIAVQKARKALRSRASSQSRRALSSTRRQRSSSEDATEGFSSGCGDVYALRALLPQWY